MTSDFMRRSYGSFGRLGPGSRIAGYLVEEQIGAGGMAVVFRARDEVLSRLAALKVIAPSLADDEEFRARFLRESRAGAAVHSPHIVPVYAAGDYEGLLYIATRFIAGGDLARLLRRCGGRLADDQAASFTAQVASALDAAHAAGLVHRDVTLANILVDIVPELPEHAYLSDFGLSKEMSSTGLTASGQFLGTPDYSAPEQIMSDHVDGRADQYALGCVAFTLLTGTPPFRRREALATLFAHLQDPVPLVTGMRPDLPAAVDGVIARALAKSPADRYSRCGEFAAALQEALFPAQPADGPARGNRPAHATGQPTGTREGTGHASAITAGADGAGHSGDTPGQDPGRGRGKVRAIWAAGTAAVLAAGIAAAVVLHGPSPKPGAAQPTAGRATSLRTAGAAASGQDTGSTIASRVLAGENYGFTDPTDIAADGNRIWIVNNKGNSVTELNASDGSWIRTLSGGTYDFNDPYGIAADGNRIWIANNNGDSVTELNASDGSWVRTLSGAAYDFKGPTGIAADGTHVWVTNSRGGSVTELNASDGSWIRTLSGGTYDFNDPYGIAADGNRIWVGNYNGDSVTELNASDGSWIRTLSGGTYDFSGPFGIAADGTHVWVTNNNGHSVTELNASDGSWVQTPSGSDYGFSYPTDIAVSGNRIWVTNYGRGSVTELSASDGSWVRTLSGGTYDFNHPYGIAADGNRIWVANNNGHSVTELTTG
jgi:serine/threonine-protein kinase